MLGTSAKWIAVLEEKGVKPGQKAEQKVVLSSL